jgi:hypothetical protein
MKHTELPWVVSTHKDKFHKNELLRIRQKGNSSHVCGLHKCPERQANAAFICHAVNNHYKLVEALKELRDLAVFKGVKVWDVAAITKADAALASATGGGDGK